jgi:hypothetical protein
MTRRTFLFLVLCVLGLSVYGVASLTADTPCDELIMAPSLEKFPQRCWGHPKLESFREANDVIGRVTTPDSTGWALDVYSESRHMWPNDPQIKQDMAEGIEAAVDKSPLHEGLFYYVLDRWDEGDERFARRLLVKMARNMERAIGADSSARFSEGCSETRQMWVWDRFEMGSNLVRVYDRLMPLGNEGKQWKYFRAEMYRRIHECDPRRSMGYMGSLADQAFLDYVESGHEGEAELFVRSIAMPDSVATRLRKTIRNQPEEWR